MMYHTSTGSRVLSGPEAEVFKAGLALVAEQLLDINTKPHFDISAFDRLTNAQKFWLLRTVGGALLNESEPEPALTAAVEATVAVVFNELRAFVKIEIEECNEGKSRYEYRTLICQAWNSIDSLHEGNPFDLRRAPKSNKTTEWNYRLYRLSDRILWDEDFKDEVTLDSPPEVADLVKHTLGIEDDGRASSVISHDQFRINVFQAWLRTTRFQPQAEAT